MMVPLPRQRNFFSTNLDIWIKDNVSGKHDVSWLATFGDSIWSVWTSRNKEIFGHNKPSIQGLQYETRYLCENILAAFLPKAVKLDRMLTYIHWSPPPVGVFKINFDGCTKGNLVIAGAGGVFRDHQDN